jgi:Flp pilus assembly protein CpaB
MNAPDFTLGSPKRSLAPRRQVGRGKSLPSGRAATGALLIVLSGVGLAAAAQKATAEPTTRYAIATRDIDPGELLTSGDIRMVTMKLATPVARRSFASEIPLVGAVTVSPISSGELMQSSAVQRGGPSLREMSFPIDASRALNGSIDSGDRIDIVATSEGAGGKSTVTVLSNMQVISVLGTGLDGESAATIVIKVAIEHPADQVTLAQAANTAQLFVVKANDANVAVTAPASVPARQSGATK